MAFNIVEAIQEDDADCAFDQPCRFGHRVEGHAVYCHNDAWPDGPLKCRRTWYTGGEVKDEDCPGFQPNPEFKGELQPTPLAGTPCSKCNGAKLVNGDRETVETCPRCMGDGTEPSSMTLSQFAQNVLECCCVPSGRNPAQYEHNTCIAETKEQAAEVNNLDELNLIAIRSMQWTKAGATVFLYQMTAKGDAVMRANWEKAEAETKEGDS